MRKSIRYIIPFLTWLLPIIYLITGCAKDDSQFKDDLLTSLVDTVYAGEQGEVLLTNLTGGFYFDDAFRTQNRSEYGYSYWERKLIAGWEILDLKSNKIDTEPDVCIITPDKIERHFLSGVIETVECPIGLTGLLLTIDPGMQKGVIVKPMIDVRQIHEMESAFYNTQLHNESGTFVVSRTDKSGGFLAIAGISEKGFQQIDARLQIDHPLSEKLGRVSSTDVFQGSDYIYRSHKSFQISFGWGRTEEDAAFNADRILKTSPEWREERYKWMNNVLFTQAFTCDNRSFVRAFNWARLMLAGLMAERNGERFLITGIPHSPYPDGWFTMWSLDGIAASELSSETPLNLIDVIIDYQNQDSLSKKYGMFPGRISEDEIEYRIPEVGGLAAMKYQRLTNVMTKTDTVREDRLALALVTDLVGTLKYRMCQGLVVSGPYEHFLWDGPAAPEREGATIETQNFFTGLRNFLKGYKRLHMIADLPIALFDQSSFHMYYLAEYGNLTINPGGAPGVSGSYQIPLSWNIASQLFHNMLSGWGADRLRFLKEKSDSLDAQLYSMHDNMGLSFPLTGTWTLSSMYEIDRDTTQRVSIPLFDWYFDITGGKRRKKQEDRDFNSYFGEVGFRSLPSTDDNYQEAHLYYLDDAPHGTMSMGDVLLWTSGYLGDIYVSTNDQDSLLGLVNALAERIENASIIGGLPEAENNVQLIEGDNSVGNGIFAASQANFIYLVSTHILGLKPSRGNYIRIRPTIPEDWGNYRYDCSYLDGSFVFERVSRTDFIVSQNDIKPILRIVLDMSLPIARTAQVTVRLRPGERKHVSFSSEDGHIWKSKVVKYE